MPRSSGMEFGWASDRGNITTEERDNIHRIENGVITFLYSPSCVLAFEDKDVLFKMLTKQGAENEEGMRSLDVTQFNIENKVRNKPIKFSEFFFAKFLRDALTYVQKIEDRSNDQYKQKLRIFKKDFAREIEDLLKNELSNN